MSSFKQWAMRLVRKATLAVSSADRHEQIDGHVTDEDDPDYQQPVLRFQWYGFRSRPGAGPGTELITVAPEGGTSQRVAVAGEVSGQGPTDQEDWEVEIYCKYGQRIRLNKNGQILIDAASGQDIILNQGSAHVARVGDACKIIAVGNPGSFLAAWMQQVETALNAIAAGTVTPLSSTFVGTPGIEVNAGAPHVKG